MKTLRVLCVGKVVDGKVVITKPTIEAQMDAQLERNAELIQMNTDLNAMQRKKVNSFRCNDQEIDELLDAIENDYEWIRRGC